MTTTILLTALNILIMLLWMGLWRWTKRLNKKNGVLIDEMKRLNKDTRAMLERTP